MESEIKVITYPNGEIQRVQMVRFRDWGRLDFLHPTPDASALDCFADIYENYLIPACPWIFPKLVLSWDSVKESTEVTKNRVVRGKLPGTKNIIVDNICGYLSQTEPEAAMKVNASFFIMDPIDCATKYDHVGTTLGLCVKNGEVLNPPLFHREALLVDKSGNVEVKAVDIRELGIEIDGKMYWHGENATIYTRPECKKTPKDATTKLVVIGRSVVDVKDGGSVPVPASGFVVSIKENTGGRSKKRKVAAGDVRTERITAIPDGTVTYHGLSHIRFGIQVGNSVIRDGVKTEKFISRFYNIRKLERVPFPPSLYPMDYEKARAARIVLGADKEGNPMLLWAEGAGKLRYIPGEDSCGASLSEMADIAAELGMHHGVHLDGGGSAQILLHNQRSLKISDRNKNDNSEAERLVPLGLIIK